jgi:Protein involved in initiation of plasmid replication
MNAISEVKVEDKQFYLRKVSVKELERKLKVQLKYDRVKELCMELKKKPIFIEKSAVKGKRKFIVLDWFASLEYDEKTASIEYEISSKLAPYLLELQKRITKANLAYILPMKSFYSMRLYILLKEYQKIGSRTFEVAELQELLQVGKSLKGYNQFKVNVLNKAIKEINKTDLYIELTESKKERKKVIENNF